MSLEFLIPAAKAHAIQSVSFILEWQDELSDQTLSNVQMLGNSLKSDFPEALIQKMVKINLGQQSNPLTVDGHDMLGGMVFIRKGRFGDIVSQINISRLNCVVMIKEYSRWVPTLEAVMRYLKIVTPVIMKEKSINTVALQYIDVFTWKDDPKNLNLNEIFLEDSPYIAPNALEQKGLWHCHHGYWIQEFENLNGNCLDNINIDTVESSGDRAIQITTIHKFALNEPLRLSTSNYLTSIEDIENKLHMHNKKILKQLLSSEVCKKINLELDEGA
ncbi:MAG: TIGR04255 family protein [Nitrosomonas sp.]|nr:TIGR04255 family protein [Nitrosomonas sp.]